MMALNGGIHRIGKAQAFAGYAFGLRQPCIRYLVRLSAVTESSLQELDRFCAAMFGAGIGAEPLPAAPPVLARVLYWTQELLRQAGHPVLEEARWICASEAAGDHLVVQPCLHPEAADGVVRYLVGAAQRVLAGALTQDENERWRADLERLRQRLNACGLCGFNTLHFLIAARELDIPWQHLGGNLFQFGQGARARWLDSAFTDATPVISTRLAKNKMVTANFLRANGLPVPDHLAARDAEHAVRCAERLGYPVVVKPADRDGGKGVKANLRTAAAVRKAFAAANAISRNILVEKHAPGRDYRIQVVCGEVQGVIERIPGGVTGNGVDTVRILLERQNEERRTATDDRRYLHAMVGDEEAEEQLEDQGLSWDAIPAAGRFVRLRGAANVASGGVPVPVPLERVHPDNLALAIRAARVLRLDTAGIDLLIPDIAVSWRECGAHICEVNAQPQMFTTLHAPMLASLMNGSDGRIPTVVILAPDVTGWALGEQIHRTWRRRGVSAGLAADRVIAIGDDQLTLPAADSHVGGRILSRDPAVEAMILCVSDDACLRRGWPVDRCDVLIVLARQSGIGESARQLLAENLRFAASLAPCRVMLVEGGIETARRARAVFGDTANLDILPADCGDEMLALRAIETLPMVAATRKDADAR